MLRYTHPVDILIPTLLFGQSHGPPQVVLIKARFSAALSTAAVSFYQYAL
jgi:hypothetical protein